MEKSTIDLLSCQKLDISNEEHFQLILCDATWEELVCHNKIHGFSNYIREGGETNIFLGECPVFICSDKDHLCVLHQGSFYPFEIKSSRYELPSFPTDAGDNAPAAVITPSAPRQYGNKHFKNMIVLNGDESAYFMDDEENLHPLFSLDYHFADEDRIPTLSFRCLAELTGENVWVVGNRLHNGSLMLVDYDPDQRIALTKEEKTAIRKGGKKDLKPPEVGFTLVHETWHRSATVVVQDCQRNAYYLIGQDEGTYFGCELAESVKNLKAAYTSLIPKKIRHIRNINRQGEWFFVPVKEKNVPPITESIAIFNTYESVGGLALPIDNADAARHYVQTNDGRIGSDGVIYAFSPILAHSEEEHSDVSVEGWHTFVRNTAKRSVSIKGVD